MTDKTLLTTEAIARESTGVVVEGHRHKCIQCGNKHEAWFHHYYSTTHQREITYCRKCLQLGRMDNFNTVIIVKTHQESSLAPYSLPFNLSKQQLYASQKVVEAIKKREDLLLYAVTGAGKTEMIFEAIQLARQRGDNVAVVSPRVDVVIELSYRIVEAFELETIDVLYQGMTQKGNGHFVIATTHQLLRFKSHFDTIFVDEVDAFPLSQDPSLWHAINEASKSIHSHIYMSATPNKSLLAQFTSNQIVKLPARFHRYPLPLPKFKLFKLNPSKKQLHFYQLLVKQIEKGRYTLVFFNHIETMQQTYDIYKKHIESLICVHSEDALRHEKVEGLRRGKHRVVFTTTILERGFTMAKLDVVVINSHTFSKDALVQIAGRVGRKKECPTGDFWFYHEGLTMKMIQARNEIKKMNKLGRARGWLRE
ncbi:helicase-related protein [Staphylococcus sp. SQ8-PEA]|uniref:Helicase-related protein n=1 Tax=Staphylococcus marylandisciuri TaxID=2981529 RepID=A0ABT2QPD2_9STAP|nr:helicase-related protein [Staphylococcus marylandisciuri]MCU5745834.1 helicase-related protein [Staphylococcus marylandisciuri]